MKNVFVILCSLNIFIGVAQERVDFDKYISYFGVIQTDTIIKSEIFPSNLEVDKRYIIPFIKEGNDCECEKGELWFRYVKKIEKEKYIIAFINKDCDIPRKWHYPYNEDILCVYTKEGQIVDSKIISRSGDLWEYTLEGTKDPFKLKVEQASVSYSYWETNTNYPIPCKINTYTYSVTEDGRIEQKLLSSEKGSIIWDKGKQKRQLIKTDL